MNDDLERDLRDRLHRAELPPTPAALRTRLQGVVATPPARQRETGLERQLRLVLPLAAVLVIGAMAIMGGGSRPAPRSSSSPDPSSIPAGPTHAELTVEAAVFEPCSPGGCEFHVELMGPAGSWQGRLDFANLGDSTGITPRFPEILSSSGSYSVRTEIHVFGDAIYPGETGPRDLGITATCTSEFTVAPDTQVVVITLGFWLDRCSAGTIATADPASLATLSVLPTAQGECGTGGGGCDYRMALTGPGGSWAATVGTVKPADQLVIGPDMVSMITPGSYRLQASSHRMSLEPAPGVGHQQELDVAATCTAEFVVAPESGLVDVSVSFMDETCTVVAEVRILGSAQPSVGPVATPAASPHVTCEPNPTDLPGLDCERAVEAVLAALEPGHPPVEQVHFFHQCWSTDPSIIVDCAVQAVGIVEITFVGVSEVRRYGVTGLPWTGVSVTLLTPVSPDPTPSQTPEQRCGERCWAFGPEYLAEPPHGHSVAIEGASISEDKRTLTVEFSGGGCYAEFVPWVGQSKDELLVGIFDVARPEPLPSRLACIAIAFTMTYQLALPEPFTGRTVRDINRGVLVLD